jgi:hypothetical protein
MKSNAPQRLDIIQSVRFYVDKIVSDPAIAGMALIFLPLTPFFSLTHRDESTYFGSDNYSSYQYGLFPNSNFREGSLSSRALGEEARANEPSQGSCIRSAH